MIDLLDTIFEVLGLKLDLNKPNSQKGCLWMILIFILAIIITMIFT